MRREGATVLVVEDDPVIREVFRDTLELAGYRVAVSDDVASAGSILRQVAVAVILTDAYGTDPASPDLAFPGPLRGAAPRAPIILCSARAWAAKFDPGPHGLYAVLRKPCDIDDLLAVVYRALRCSNSPGPASPG